MFVYCMNRTVDEFHFVDRGVAFKDCRPLKICSDGMIGAVEEKLIDGEGNGATLGDRLRGVA